MRFVKAHAYGNDFLIANAAEMQASDLADVARRACDRHRGIGADGLMWLGWHGGTPFMRLINADGSPSEISGNGLRCVAAWLALRDGTPVGATLSIDTDAGTKRLELLGKTGQRLT